MHHATEERFAYQSQAGRILPEYRAVRNSLSGFKELVETPELVAEVIIQPGDLLDVDDVIANYKLNVTDVKIVDSKDTFN